MVGFVSHKIHTHYSLPVLLTCLFPRLLLLSPLDLGLCHFSFQSPNPTTSSVCLYILLPSLLPVEGKAFVWHSIPFIWPHSDFPARSLFKHPGSQDAPLAASCNSSFPCLCFHYSSCEASSILSPHSNSFQPPNSI